MNKPAADKSYILVYLTFAIFIDKLNRRKCNGESEPEGLWQAGLWPKLKFLQ